VERHWSRSRDEYVAAIGALRRIHDEGLFRATHRSWKAYVEERWGISRQYSYRLIQQDQINEMLALASESDSTARSVALGVASQDDIPAETPVVNPTPVAFPERWTRELAPIKDDDQAKKRVIAAFADGNIRSAGDVKKEVQKIVDAKSKPAPAPKPPDPAAEAAKAAREAWHEADRRLATALVKWDEARALGADLSSLTALRSALLARLAPPPVEEPPPAIVHDVKAKAEKTTADLDALLSSNDPTEDKHAHPEIPDLS
jgi:hypothetical protein